MRALDGIRVVDFTQVIAGPFATQHLAYLGADVIKIEQPGVGDQGRFLLGDNDWGKARLSPMFLSVNAGKRSMTLDLKNEKAKEVVWQLIDTADVVMENFKAGVIEKLGFGYEAVKARKPDIVYCSVSGYGQTGPYAGAAAYDVNGGFMGAIDDDSPWEPVARDSNNWTFKGIACDGVIPPDSEVDGDLTGIIAVYREWVLEQ